MSVHFRILSADGITLLDQELAEASGSVDVSTDEVRRLLDASSGDKLMFAVSEASDTRRKHKLPCDWSVLDG